MNILTKQAYWAMAFALALTACSDHQERMAKLRAEHTQHYEQQLAQQRDSLHLADSLLLEVTPIINQLISEGNFVFEKNEFDDLGRYYVTGTTAADRIGESYVHAAVNEYGITQLISEYRGSRHINHERLSIQASDGTGCQTLAVPVSQEGGANYQFDNQGTCHETVTFTSGLVGDLSSTDATKHPATDNGALAFIAQHRDDRKMKVQLLDANGHPTSVTLTNKDLDALAKTYDLGHLLSIQVRCTQMSKTAAGKIQFLQTKLGLIEQPN